MRGGLRRLVNPSSVISEIDLDGTRAERQAVREELRLRQHLVDLLERSAPCDDRLSISTFNVLNGEDGGGSDGQDDAT